MAVDLYVLYLYDNQYFFTWVAWHSIISNRIYFFIQRFNILKKFHPFIKPWLLTLFGHQWKFVDQLWQIFIQISMSTFELYIFSNNLDIYRALSLPLFPASGLSIFIILDRSLYLTIQVGGENGHLFHLLFPYFFNWGTWHRITSNRIHFFIWCFNNFKFSSFSWHRGCWLLCSKADGA